MDGTPGARVYSSLIFFQIDQNQWSLLTALKNCSCILGYLIMGVLSQSPVILDKTRFKSFTISCTYLQGERGPQGDRGPPGAAVSIFFHLDFLNNQIQFLVI